MTQWYVLLSAAVTLLSASAARGGELPEEVRADVQRIYVLGEKFDKTHISETCTETEETPFRCFRQAFMKAVHEKEPTVTGYVVLLSIGTLVLAEERQKTIDSKLGDGEKERALQANSLDTAELLIETLERVASKAKVLSQELPVAESLRKTLRTRAEAILKQKAPGRSLASSTSPKGDHDRREALLTRLSDIETK